MVPLHAQSIGIAGAGLLLGAETAKAAQSKAPQSSVNYQATAKGSAQCDNCRDWVSPASCKVVEGVIAPGAWCVLYAPKPAA